MKALKKRQVRAIMIGLSLSWVANSAAVAQHVKDPPWSPDHIDHLPLEVRSVVLAMCAKSPSAGHYFATYSQNAQQINLHFEKFHCEQGPAFCTAWCELPELGLKTTIAFFVSLNYDVPRGNTVAP